MPETKDGLIARGERQELTDLHPAPFCAFLNEAPSFDAFFLPTLWHSNRTQREWYGRVDEGAGLVEYASGIGEVACLGERDSRVDGWQHGEGG